MNIRFAGVAVLVGVMAGLVPYSAKAQTKDPIENTYTTLRQDMYAYQYTLNVRDPAGISDPSYLNLQSEAVYQRLIEDYAVRNPWTEVCRIDASGCTPVRVDSRFILESIWYGLPREIGEAGVRARVCADKIKAGDLVVGAATGMVSVGARTTVIDVYNGTTKGIPGFVLTVGRGALTGAALGAAKAARRVCGD